MAPFPLRPELRPTLPELLAPYWRRLSGRGRAAIAASAVLLVVIVVGAALTLQDPHYGNPGPPPFSFTYKGLYRVPAPKGAFVEVDRVKDGRVDASFVVEPLTLPPYAGSLTGELPLYSAGVIHQLELRDPQAALTGAGKTRINKVPGYGFTYTTSDAGGTIYGRDILLLPNVPGVRVGVVMVMRERPGGALTSSTLVGADGILQNPVRSFKF
jgi:hypothetical protein